MTNINNQSIRVPLYWVSDCNVYETPRGFRVQYTSSVDPRSKMPPATYSIWISKEKTGCETYRHAANYVAHKAIKRLRAYYNGTKTVQDVRASVSDKITLSAIQKTLDCSFGKGWTYTNEAAQNVALELAKELCA
jgi:hypothetical protein